MEEFWNRDLIHYPDPNCGYSSFYNPGRFSVGDPPFGSLYKVGVVVDNSLTKVTDALFGAGSFTESLRIKLKDYLKMEEPVKGDIGENAGLKIQKNPAASKKKKVKSKKK